MFDDDSKFDPSLCKIKKIWCGKTLAIPPSKANNYYKIGSKYECLRAGFGAGRFSNQNLPESSLKNIRYIGKTYDKKFKNLGINTIDDLVFHLSFLPTISDFEVFLKNILTKKNGIVDLKAYNSMLLFLYNFGLQFLPACEQINYI